MPDKTTGVLLKSEDGHNYFIPLTDLEGFAVDDAEVDDQHILEHAPPLKAWAAEQTDGPHSPVMAMMAH